MLILQVYIHLKSEFVEAFLAATKENSQASIQETGCVRFDVLQQKDDPTRILLHEIYRHESDLDSHRTQPHFFKWRETVADMFAEPRYSVQLNNLFPPDSDFR